MMIISILKINATIFINNYYIKIYFLKLKYKNINNNFIHKKICFSFHTKYKVIFLCLNSHILLIHIYIHIFANFE
jgi:hypothetical protein